MNQIDLCNIFNAFIIADCHQSPRMEKSMKLLKTVRHNGTVKAFLYRCNGDYVLTFTPFDFTDLTSFVRTGYGLVTQQELVSVGKNDERMNSFFNHHSKLFVSELSRLIRGTGDLYITGISMGGALGQCFYYHLAQQQKIRRNVVITTFGAPRIGNAALSQWFMCATKTTSVQITNYVLFKKFGNYRRVDPVCLFPAGTGYCNNYNLTAIYNGSIEEGASYCIEQPDTDITTTSLIWDRGLKEDIGLWWEEIHDIGVYAEALEKCDM